ncbi:MAG TPA: outer membrane beta-barrel protein [Opitutaceae bacterium]|nr:outer membrane beta-barrel protein [Opitutaceae bacterium]
MKTLPACLLLGLFAASSAAAADLSFSFGYGTARLDGGQAGDSSSSSSLLPKDVAGSVNVLRLSLGLALTDRIGIEGSYLDFSELTTEHQLNPNGPESFVAVDNRFRRKAQALAVGPTYTWMPAEGWQIAAAVGGVLSDLRTNIDGGGHGVQVYKTTGNPGWFGSINASYALSQQVAVGVSVRYIDFNRKMASSSSLTAQHADLFLTLRF